MTDGERSAAEFLECVVELIRAHGKHPGVRFGHLLWLALRDDGLFEERMVKVRDNDAAAALREYADAPPLMATSGVAVVLPATRSCHLHDDCDAADADRRQRTGKPSVHCTDSTCDDHR